MQPVFAMTGIANPKPFVDYLQKHTALLAAKAFADHHYYSEDEIEAIFTELARSTSQAVVVTTEKDAVRLLKLKLPEEIKKRIYYIPVSVKFLFNSSEEFNNQILSYVRENKSDSSFH
ncbi:MAG TPA: tetraacyldisaccharide 4'-kinase, partial [Tenuifilaceae bacterium]|nr:tetraacyldisaccharide 4'-kinase [Tenuifilaceae bacterium]